MIIVRTPLRVSFFGGGTDFPAFFSKHGGAVLGCAVDKFIYHTVSRFPSWLFDHKLRIAYRRVEAVNTLDEIQHAPYREILRHCGVLQDVELGLAADLPSFSGLGSSSSFTVGLVKGLHAFRGLHIDSETLARTAIHVEREILGETVGLQDQILAAYGGLNVVSFSGEEDFSVERIPISAARRDELNNSLILVYSGITRKAQDVEAKKMRNLAGITSRLQSMRSMVDDGLSILAGRGSLTAFGELLHCAWEEKRALDDCVTTPEIDTLYGRARAAGAIGGKLLGAGGGGFVLLFVPPDRQVAVRSALHGYHEVAIRLGAPGSSIIHS